MKEKAVLCKGTNRLVHAIFWEPELHQSNCYYMCVNYIVVIVQEWHLEDPTKSEIFKIGGLARVYGNRYLLKAIWYLDRNHKYT